MKLPMPSLPPPPKKPVLISLVNLFNLNADCLSLARWLPQYNSHSSFTFFGNSVIHFFLRLLCLVFRRCCAPIPEI